MRTEPPSERRTNRRLPDQQWMYQAFWLLYLIFPIAVLLLGPPRKGWQQVGGSLLIAGFIATWLIFLAVVVSRPRAERGIRAPLLFAGLLLACIMGLASIIGTGAFPFGAFLIVLAAQCFPVAITAGTFSVVFGAGAAALAMTLMTHAAFGGMNTLTLTDVLFLAGVGLWSVLDCARQARQARRQAEREHQRKIDEQLAVIAERERVARDVHDILGHSLTVLAMKSQLAGRLVDLDPERAKVELGDMYAISREALTEVRATVSGLRSPDLATELLNAATALTAAEIEASLPETADAVAPEHRALFAWVLREAVTNVVRHSGASRCSVKFTASTIQVRDNGNGNIDEAEGHGLRGLRERVAAAGGELIVAGDRTGVVVEARTA